MIRRQRLLRRMPGGEERTPSEYAELLEPNGFKAQVVARSRTAAARYRAAIERNGGPKAALIVSHTNDDPVEEDVDDPGVTPDDDWFASYLLNQQLLAVDNQQ